VTGDFGGADEVQIWSNGDTLKRYAKKAAAAVIEPIEPEAAESPEPKKAKK
jgi:hypothetical protein